MAQPLPYERDFDFAGFQSSHPSTPLPGDKVNLELDQVAAVVDEIRERIRILQRDDLQNANQSVGWDQLKPELRNGFSTPTVWAIGVDYPLGASVYVGRKVYAALVAHKSVNFGVDLAGGKWYLLADFTAVTQVDQTAVEAAQQAIAAATAAQGSALAAAQTVAQSAANAQAAQNSATAASASQTASANSASAASASASAAAVSATESAAAATTVIAAQKGAANGLASLDAEGKIPTGQLPLDATAFATRADVVSASVLAADDFIQTAGYAAIGDGGAAVYKRVASEPAHGGKVQSSDGTWWELAVPEIRPEMFGAKGDGSTDDTAAVAIADAYCRFFTPTKQLVFGAKTYRVSQMVIRVGTRWKGQGKNGTIIQQIVGSNKSLMYGVNSEENFVLTNQNDYLAFPYDFEIDGFDLDGNWNDGAGNTSGHGFFVVGDHYNVRNLYVRNCAECGIIKKFIGDHPDNYDSRYLETAFKHIRVDYVGKHGFWDLGPHDSVHEDIIVLDAGQSATNTYDGFNHDGSSSRNIAIHPATRSGRARMRYAVSTWNGSMNEWSGGCNIEGAQTANLGLFSSGNQFDPSTRFYAAWGGVNILLGGTCRLNIIRGALQGPPAGRPVCAGIKFSENAADTVARNDIDLLMADQDGGAVQFNASNKGDNKIRVKVYTTANVGVFGTVSELDDVHIRGTINGSSRYELNNMNQSTFLASVPAGGSFTWTFPFKFRQNPDVQATITLPTVAPTQPVWVNELTTTSVKIFNPNSNAQPVNVSARGVY